jgi:hypothetical protein
VSASLASPPSQKSRGDDDPVRGAQNIYRAFMGLEDGGDTERAHTIQNRKLRRSVERLLAENARLSAQLSAHGDKVPRAHAATDYTASATGVRLLKPLHGEWVLVRASPRRVGGDDQPPVVQA